MSEPLWQPSEKRIKRANMTRFRDMLAERLSRAISGWDDLHRISIEDPDTFWPAIIDFAEIKAETWGSAVLKGAGRMPGAKWFPEARLNFAENLLAPAETDPDADAIVFRGEGASAERRLSFGGLRDRVSRLARALTAAGVKAGDRVAGYLPNMPETVVAMLATNAVGAVWSSCSPDFGVQGVLDRFGQIEPKVLIASDGYWYDARRHDCLAKTAEIAKGLPTLTQVVIAPYGDAAVGSDATAAINGAVSLDDFLAPFEAGAIDFARLPFDHPLYILFSSGTTGAPKCIVHCQGGAILKHATEHLLHCDVRNGDRVFFFTTCGWMMWNWLVGNLAWGAAVLLYDGSPFSPDPNALFDFAADEHATLFGVSAKFIDAIGNAGIKPADTHDLTALRTFCATGSPLAPEGFDYVYDNVKSDMHLASISGGTDIMGCFVAGDPTRAVWRGEIQAPVLGMAVEVFDEAGKPVTNSTKGELVCTRPFPSMPVGFWGDDAGQSRYRAAYFEGFGGVWTHGDFVSRTEHGGYVIYGRSDATLNPGGVRIGTAEIYRQVETLEQVVESIVIGQEWDNDTRIVLFVVLAQGAVLDEALTQSIRDRIRANCSPRHVPRVILQVADIPRTKSGKITELAVRDVVHGREVKNVEALANPGALEYFRDRAELAS